MSRARTSEPASTARGSDEGEVVARDTGGSSADAGAGASANSPGERGEGGEVDVEPEAEAGGGGGGDDVGDEDEGGDGPDAPAGTTWGRALLLGAALAFLGFAVGMVVTRDRPPGEGSADVGFYRDMLTHHQQALGVASLEAANGEDPTVRSYAQEVLTFQSYEVGVMRQTLSEWGYDPSARPDEAMGWMGMPVPVAEMPGLLNEEEMEAMTDARGAEADALFLDLMAEHHRGGLHMSEAAGDEVGDDGVRELAALMARNQAQEINEYRAAATRNGIDVDIPPADVPPSDLPE